MGNPKFRDANGGSMEIEEALKIVNKAIYRGEIYEIARRHEDLSELSRKYIMKGNKIYCRKCKRYTAPQETFHGIKYCQRCEAEYF